MDEIMNYDNYFSYEFYVVSNMVEEVGDVRIYVRGFRVKDVDDTTCYVTYNRVTYIAKIRWGGVWWIMSTLP
jgi:catabolite regulation protein CreA